MGLAAIGTGGLLAVAGTTVLARPAHAGVQDQWRWCSKCQALFYGGASHKGRCAAGGEHVGGPGTSYNYLPGHIEFGWQADGQFHQFNWRFCGRCLQMTYAGIETGWCPGSGRHAPTTSYNYAMVHDLPRADYPQPGWRWCRKCQNIAYAGNGAGPCANSGRHDHSGSYPYFQYHDR
jgi:hypothetical protein